MRYVIYFAPHEDSMLWHTGCRWLERDPVSGAELEQPFVAGFASAALRELTAAPRRYGFHATLKAPFVMAEDMSYHELYAELAAFASSVKPFTLPQLELERMGSFMALCLSEQLDTLAAECVARFDHFRQPPTSQEQARRGSELSENRKALLDQWGYPYVMDEWRFHMTLTGEIYDESADTNSEFLTGYFHDALRESLSVSDLCVFLELSAGAEFRLAARFPLSEPG